jgi:virginiamycin B lyase
MKPFTFLGTVVVVVAALGARSAALTITEFSVPTAPSSPVGVTAGPDGNLWFTDSGGTGKIGKVTTTGTFREYVVPTVPSAPYSTPYSITAGPDGNLWFTEYDTNKIGKITPAGTFTEYMIPTLGSLPVGIIAGADGNLWFTESGTGVIAGLNKIGQVTTVGVFGEYAIPTAGSAPGIARHRGQVWIMDLRGQVMASPPKMPPTGFGP